MTRHEIIEAGLKGIGKARVQGDTTEPALPFLLGDLMFQHYLRAIKEISPLKQEMKRLNGLWQKEYGLFNRPFFSQIPPESQEDVTDMMDSLAEVLSNELTMLRAGTMGMFHGLDFEQKKIASDFMVAHIFAQFALVAWKNTYAYVKRTYTGAKLEQEVNPRLARLRDVSFRMCMTYIRLLPGKGDVEISNPKIDGLFRIIAKKIYDWLKQN